MHALPCAEVDVWGGRGGVGGSESSVGREKWCWEYRRAMAMSNWLQVVHEVQNENYYSRLE